MKKKRLQDGSDYGQGQGLMGDQGGQQMQGGGQMGLMGGNMMPQGSVAGMISNLANNGASMGGNLDSFMQTPFQQPGSQPPMGMTAGGMAPIGPSGMPAQDAGSVSAMNQQQQNIIPQQQPNTGFGNYANSVRPAPPTQYQMDYEQWKADEDAKAAKADEDWKYNMGIYN